MSKRYFGVLIIFFVGINSIFSQEMLNPKDDFLFDGKYFDPYSPYVTIGAGYGINYQQQEGEQNLAVDYHMNFGDLATNLGYFSSSDRYLDGGGGLRQYHSRQRLHDLHLGAGWRHERLKHNFAIYGGVSFAAGRTPTQTEDGNDAFIVRRIPGVYLQTHYSHKPAYDVGYGVTLYAVYSRFFKIVGVQAHIFLSSAFKAYNR